MTMLRSMLFALERLHTPSDRVLGTNIGGTHVVLATHECLMPDGHLTHVMAPFLDSDEEVEVEIDEAAGVYRYFSPRQRTRVVTRPLAEIALYRFRLDAIFDHLTTLLDIRPTATTRRRCLVDGHLWYLGAFRIGKASAPVFYGRALPAAPAGSIETALADYLLGSGGVVLTPTVPRLALPLRRQLRAIDDLLYMEDGQERFDLDGLGRILSGLPAESENLPDEWFDEAQGRLKLRHLPEAKSFEGIQKKIISIFWKARDGAPLRWTEDVKAQSGSVAPTLDKAMGGKEKREPYIDLVMRGHYRLRRQ